jgi:hypothetical protein
MRPRLPRLVLVISFVVLGLLAVTAGGASAVPSAAPRACTSNADPVVFDLRHITVHRACALGDKLLDSKVDKHLVRCPASGIGIGTLLVHKFDGYHLSIKDTRLEMSRGRVSFQFASYSDAPVGCD